MKNKKVTKKGKRKTMSYSEELREFCEEFLGSDELIIAADTFANWDGDWRLKNLPPDAPKGMRKNLEAVNKAVKDVRPAFDALEKALKKIGS